jgi:hypothetical protein
MIDACLHAREMSLMRYTPMRCTLEVHAYEVHACEANAHEIHPHEIYAHRSVAFSLDMKCQRTLSGNLARTTD